MHKPLKNHKWSKVIYFLKVSVFVFIAFSPFVMIIFTKRPTRNYHYRLKFDTAKPNQRIQLSNEDMTEWNYVTYRYWTDNSSRQLITLNQTQSELLLNKFCDLSSNKSEFRDWQNCCSTNTSFSDRSLTIKNCLTYLGSLGMMPDVKSLNRSSQTTLPSSPQEYVLSSIYDRSIQLVNNPLKCPVPLHKRQKLYELLCQWIEIAKEHGIVWWITYGTLLGSVRNQDLIPYDHDFDLAILGSHEAVVRNLATERKYLNSSKMNIVTRPGNYCTYDRGSRLDCWGNYALFQYDTCSFCTPLARLISNREVFIDLFLTHVELIVNSQGDLIDCGLFDESIDGDKTTNLTYPLDSVFPLTTCKLMGLELPCPRKPDIILTKVYGSSYMTPNLICSPAHGIWYT